MDRDVLRSRPSDLPTTFDPRGPLTAAAVRALQRRNEEKRAEALQFLGDRWILHPKNKVR